MKILNFGSCNIDYVYSLDHIVAAGETETSGAMNIFPGGKGLNQSIALARAGAKVRHAGCVGADGSMLLDILKENGVDISDIKRTDGKNGHAIIQVSRDGENSIFLYPGSNVMITEEYVCHVLEDFSEGDIILLQNEINELEYIVEKAFEKGMCIVLNPSPCNEKIRDIDFNMLSYLILNELEAENVSGANDAAQCFKYFAENYPGLKVVLTLGKKGSRFFGGGEELYQPSFAVETVDTTAAGDTFTGYFIASVAEGKSVAEALRLASAASAIAVSRHGAAPSIPYKNEVLENIGAMKESLTDKSARLKAEIEKYLSENIKNASLDALAELLGYSSVHTGCIIKNIFRKPFSKVLQEERCSRAAKLLEESDLSAGEIINAVGYENESFFREMFKEKYGKNMLEYRNFMRGLKK